MSVKEIVQEKYGEAALRVTSGKGNACCGSSPSSCSSGADPITSDLYDELQKSELPETAVLASLGCGNPTALAELKPGEVVLDLGSGGGFDVFIAGRKVGATGRAIGVDMTPDMLAKARRNIAGYREQTGLDNVEFRLGEIEHLPVPDSSVDVIISNCVINLSPDKPQVWREMARALKPGGRVAVSDMALIKPLPAVVLAMVQALVGCVAGAVLVEDTARMAQAAGLTDLVLKSKSQYVEAMTSFEDPLYQKILEHLPKDAKPSDYITSLEVQARKPGAACCGDGCCAGG